MKNLFIVLALTVITSSAYGQFFNYGIKGGINYNANGDLTATDFNDIADTFSSSEETGFHIGLLSEIKLPLFLYIRPELVYTHTESSYKADTDKAKLKMDKIEAPVLVGFRILGIGRFFFGPSFQYIINTDLSALDNFKKSYDEFSVAGQVGIGLNFGKIGADIRYETGFTDTQATFITQHSDVPEDITLIHVDTQPQQFILSFYYKFK